MEINYKELEPETEIAIRNRRAKAYSAKVAREKEIKQNAFNIVKVVAIGIVVGLVVGIVGSMDFNTAKAEEEYYAASTETEQKYIARYGITEDYGATIITLDGNKWTLEDAPEFEDGTEVRVLFDSNGTSDVTDDIIIDITER